MLAEIIAIGSELTCGSKLDTNSQWLSRELESLGWTVGRHTTLADDMDAIVAEFRAAAGRARVVLITGGLGPTLDDLTREAVALAFDQPLVRDEASLEHIKALFAARGRAMPDRNERQADRPAGAEVLPNGCGTAPGLLLEITSAETSHACLIAVMPGVPAEMKPMFEQQVRPRLPGSDVSLCRRVIRTFGYGESEAERLLGELTARGRNPEVGITASEAVISLWVTARAASSVDAERDCAATCDSIRERLGTNVFGEGDCDLHEVTAELIRASGRGLSLLEGSTTGGLLAMWMTESPDLAALVSSASVNPAVARSAESNEAGAMAESLRTRVQGELSRSPADCVVASSPFFDDIRSDGITVRRGWIAAAVADRIELADVSMSGNLAIFRQRALHGQR